MSLEEGESGVVGRLALPRRRFPSPGIPIIIKRGLYSLLRCVPRNVHCNFFAASDCPGSSNTSENDVAASALGVKTLRSRRQNF